MARRRKQKRVVELTALLDLLFMMVFISLAQSKEVAPKVEVTQTKIEKVQESAAKPSEPQGRVAVAAIFHFHAAASNPGIPEGKYRMEGTFNYDTGTLHLGGLSWIERPPQYDMVPLSGTINHERNMFKGKIEFPHCNQFTLRKVSSSAKSPVSGVWKGEYNCSQGDTGLTLTIE